MTITRRFLSAIGDSNDPRTWSGIPYHFLRTAQAQGVLNEGLRLTVDGPVWSCRRVVWNLSRLFLWDRPGGYQYSRSFLEQLWQPYRDSIRGGVVLNCFQLFPPSLVEDSSVEKWFYLDQTLLQLFDHYGLRSTVGRRIAAEALSRERQGYDAASGIIMHSRWAARSVIEDYGISPEKVHVVVPGANLDPTVYAEWAQSEPSKREVSIEDRPLRLIFVGKDWRRKGLDRLLAAFSAARNSGFRGTLRIVGCAKELVPREYENMEGVEWLGFIDKRIEGSRFFRAVSECDVGCLLSRAEAGGIAIREFHALGLIVLGTSAGGAPEHMIAEASVAVPVSASTEEIASMLLALDRDRGRVSQLRRNALASRRTALWEESVRALAAIPLWNAAANRREIAST